jgi:hypothetical protein
MRIYDAVSSCSIGVSQTLQNCHYSGNESSLILNDSASTGCPSEAAQEVASYHSHCFVADVLVLARKGRAEVHDEVRTVEGLGPRRPLDQKRSSCPHRQAQLVLVGGCRNAYAQDRKPLATKYYSRQEEAIAQRLTCLATTSSRHSWHL